MNDYFEVRIDMDPCCEDATDLMAALLADIGFESFVPDGTGLTAYIKSGLFDRESVKEVTEGFPFGMSIRIKDTFVEGRDWNAEWEKNYFQPIVVKDRCVIHSSFHRDVPRAEYDIVIDPKMAFGTGHHATTSLMIARLLDMDLKDMSVIDMGTGTGILAILSAMRGAKPVTAIEIDGFAYENAIENVRLNNHPEITLINGDSRALDTVDEADVFIANINRNVITCDLNRYARSLKSGGVMLLSGFYLEDIPLVMDIASGLGLKEISHTERDRWVCLNLEKQR